MGATPTAGCRPGCRRQPAVRRGRGAAATGRAGRRSRGAAAHRRPGAVSGLSAAPRDGRSPPFPAVRRGRLVQDSRGRERGAAASRVGLPRVMEG